MVGKQSWHLVKRKDKLGYPVIRRMECMHKKSLLLYRSGFFRNYNSVHAPFSEIRAFVYLIFINWNFESKQDCTRFDLFLFASFSFSI